MQTAARRNTLIYKPPRSLPTCLSNYTKKTFPSAFAHAPAGLFYWLSYVSGSTMASVASADPASASSRDKSFQARLETTFRKYQGDRRRSVQRSMQEERFHPQIKHPHCKGFATIEDYYKAILLVPSWQPKVASREFKPCNALEIVPFIWYQKQSSELMLGDFVTLKVACFKKPL